MAVLLLPPEDDGGAGHCPEDGGHLSSLLAEVAKLQDGLASLCLVPAC